MDAAEFGEYAAEFGYRCKHENSSVTRHGSDLMAYRFYCPDCDRLAYGSESVAKQFGWIDAS